MLSMTIHPEDFEPARDSNVPIEAQCNAWVAERLSAAGFALKASLSVGPSLVPPWERRQNPDGSVTYRQGP